MEIVIEEDGKFLDITRVPDSLKDRSALKKYVFKRDCYVDLFENIFSVLPKKKRKTVVVTGTAGIGKSSFFLFILNLLLKDPSKLGLETKSFYYQTDSGKVTLYRHVKDNEFREEELTRITDNSIPLFADMISDGPPMSNNFGVCFVFSSFRINRFKEIIKSGLMRIMPLWSEQEQYILLESDKFQSETDAEELKKAKKYIKYFGGTMRNILSAAENDNLEIMEVAIKAKGKSVCEKFYSSGFGGIEDEISDVLVHRYPTKNDDNEFNYGICSFKFASDYVALRILALENEMAANLARRKFSSGAYGGGDDGNQFESACLRYFKISGVNFTAKPLTNDLKEIDLTFPQHREFLANNWEDQKNYLEPNILYIPTYRNMESGDAFCQMVIDGKWTLVVIQCTIAETHSVLQNGLKTIRDCYTKNSGLQVDDTVIMFMVPKNSKLKTEQKLLVQTTKKKEVKEVTRSSIKISGQYKIENLLATLNVADQEE